VRDLFRRLDPRTRILVVLAAILVVASTPQATLRPFGPYAALCLLLVLTGRASGTYLTLRCFAASPFILAASVLLLFQYGISQEELSRGASAALAVAMKGYTAALLLAFLTATTTLPELLWALRRLKAPDSLNLILGMMYRYASLLTEEYARMERARDCRTVKPLGKHRYAIYGRQLGSLIVRSWDHADRVHAAMVSRGFTGEWPTLEVRRFHSRDALYFAAVATLFAAARWWA
jgi:cobalt/nickel transport system permease protein